MKKIKTIIAFSILYVIFGLNANAQTGGPDWGGLWCIVDVDLKHDVTENGYAYYLLHNPLPDGSTIKVTEGSEANCCMGPGEPVLVGKEGDTYLRLRLNRILLVDDEEFTTSYVEITTETTVNVLTWYHPDSGMWTQVPKYYTIQLNIKNTTW